MQYGCMYLSTGPCYSVFSKIPVIFLLLILLHGIVQSFANNILTLRDDNDIIFTHTLLESGVVGFFLFFFWGGGGEHILTPIE